VLDPQNSPRALRYGIALLAVISTALLKLGLDPLLEVEHPFPFFFAAVMVSAWYGGFGPGLLATISAALISGYLFLAPAYAILDHAHGQNLRLGLFVVEGTVISWLGHRFRSAVARAEHLRVEAATLAALARTVSGSPDSDSVLQRITGAAREATTADRAHLSLRDPLSGTLMVRYQVGAGDNESRALRIAPGHGLEGTVFASAKPLRTDNYAADVRVDRNSVAAPGAVSALAVPIVLEGMVEGVLGVDNRTPRPFTDRDQRLLTSLADHAAVAVRNARLFSREQRSRAEAERANRAKDDFLARLSHEQRTPLSAVVGWARLLRSGRIEGERVDRALESIVRNAQVLTVLIDDLLVGLHGGAIEAESAGVGKGARFTVRLPLSGEGDATGVARCLDGLRVLVVDDDQAAREVGGEAPLPGS
jgi:K+-sensing histidine kinase KdpD